MGWGSILSSPGCELISALSFSNRAWLGHRGPGEAVGCCPLQPGLNRGLGSPGSQVPALLGGTSLAALPHRRGQMLPRAAWLHPRGRGGSTGSPGAGSRSPLQPRQLSVVSVKPRAQGALGHHGLLPSPGSCNDSESNEESIPELEEPDISEPRTVQTQVQPGTGLGLLALAPAREGPRQLHPAIARRWSRHPLAFRLEGREGALWCWLSAPGKSVLDPAWSVEGETHPAEVAETPLMNMGVLAYPHWLLWIQGAAPS